MPHPAETPLAQRLSHFVGWLADRRVPGPLRAPLYRAFAWWTGANSAEAELPLAHYPSLGAFFVRRLRAGARPLDPDPRAIVSPCDGRIQAVGPVSGGMILPAKGRAYAVEELLAGAADARGLEGGWAWTIYLSPRDYHRVHAPLAGTLDLVRWVAGTRRSVAPRVVARRDRVLATNERAVLHLATSRGAAILVLVGALNVGRLRVVGVEPGAALPAGGPRPLVRGEELARFEMGSTVVLLLSPGMAAPAPGLAAGTPVRLGAAIGRRV
ncbi:MAG: archaetidylserine decarboxylase [Planctomycetota bacterium]